MRITLKIIFFVLICCSFNLGQAQLKVSIILSDWTTEKYLAFGIDPLATDGYDYDLDEENAPPAPPLPSLDARFLLPEGNFSGSETSPYDYRNGTLPFTGQMEHRLKFQSGVDSIKITYQLPSEIVCDLQDLFGGVLINTQLSGTGSFTVNSANSLGQLKLIIYYNNAHGPEFKSDLNFSDWVETRTVSFGLDPLATDDVDLYLGEVNLESIADGDAKFFLPEDNFSGTQISTCDFRNGTSSSVGQKEYRLRIQSHYDSLQMSYQLSGWVTIDLVDISGGSIVNLHLEGSGSYIFRNANLFEQLKMFVNYGTTDVKQESDLIPNNIELQQNYPNPFNPTTKIKFAIKELSDVSLRIYDVLGKEVAVLVKEQLTAGIYSADFNASELSSGTYFYQLNAGGKIISKKMLLVK